MDANQQVLPLVLFDGACPLCSKEIAHYRKLRSSAKVQWLDISQASKLEESYGVSYADAMARFHVRDSQGNWHIGAYGFVEMWSHLDGYRWLAYVIRKTKLSPFMDVCYQVFAKYRVQNRCSENTCSK